MTMRAVWNGRVLAETDRTVVVEGNNYFPPESLNREYFSKSDMTSLFHWKGIASYYTVAVDGGTNPDAAWSYQEPSPQARKIENHVAFGRGVQVVESSTQRSN